MRIARFLAYVAVVGLILPVTARSSARGAEQPPNSDFSRIPAEHARSRVLASVPGTTQALEAILLAQVPQTARVSRSGVNAPDVAYHGEPQFELIETTAVARAINTDTHVLRAGERYYMCVDGVWFMSATAQGPRAVASEVPKAIYAIPVSSPAYQVTHVTVESVEDDAVVFEADPVYLGMRSGGFRGGGGRRR